MVIVFLLLLNHFIRLSKLTPKWSLVFEHEAEHHFHMTRRIYRFLMSFTKLEFKIFFSGFSNKIEGVNFFIPKQVVPFASFI